MSAELMPFTYEGATVRTVVIDGEPWFVARDICTAIGLPNLSMALQRLAADEKGVNRIDTPGGPQDMAVLMTARRRKGSLAAVEPPFRPAAEGEGAHPARADVDATPSVDAPPDVPRPRRKIEGWFDALFIIAGRSCEYGGVVYNCPKFDIPRVDWCSSRIAHQALLPLDVDGEVQR